MERFLKQLETLFLIGLFVFIFRVTLALIITSSVLSFVISSEWLKQNQILSGISIVVLSEIGCVVGAFLLGVCWHTHFFKNNHVSNGIFGILFSFIFYFLSFIFIGKWEKFILLLNSKFYLNAEIILFLMAILFFEIGLLLGKYLGKNRIENFLNRKSTTNPPNEVIK